MILHAPFSIGSNLRPCLTVGGAELSLSWERTNGEGRDVYRWELFIHKRRGVKVWSADDLRTGCQGGGYLEAFRSLLSFLTAAAESLRYLEGQGRPVGEDDNASLFPLPVVRWALENDSELTMLQLELEESEQPLLEE